MNNTGRELLGKHLYDILSPSSSRVMTIGNTSNDAYITFYTCNLPIEKGYQMGLCNETFIIVNNNSTTRVGINTVQARNTLDVNGLLAINSLTSYASNINVTNTTLSNINNIYMNGISFYKNKPLNITWNNVNSNYETTDIYNLSKVGIGSTVPKYDLDIKGSINFSDYIYHNGAEYRESQFKYLTDSTTGGMLSNIFYLNSVGIGTNSSNELVRYQLYVLGDVAIDGKIYANDYVSYKGAAANSYREFPLYNINPNNENKLVLTNDSTDINTVLYEVPVRAGRYLMFVNIPYINRSPYIFIDNQNWAEIVLVQTSAVNYSKTSGIQSKVPLEIRDINARNTQTVEFFIQANTDATYTVAVRGKGHKIEFGGISFVNNIPSLEIDSLLRVFPIKGIGLDDSFSVKKALQVTPIRYQNILQQNTSNFTFSTLGNYTAAASNVDVFINGLKYVYYSNTKKDYDISYQYNLQTNQTIFNIQLSEFAQKDDVIDIAIWPYVTADTLYVSGYYYQQVNNYPTQWLNISKDTGIRYPKDVVIDGNLIVRGNIVGGCNTDEFLAGLPAGDLSITCNIVGTLNILDGSITTSKVGIKAITNDKIDDYTIDPSKFYLKNKILVVGCNLNEVNVQSNELPRQRGMYIDGDLYIKGSVQANLFSGSSEAIIDGGITTVKLANQAVTFPKIASYSLSNSLIPDNAISTRTIQNNAITPSKILAKSITGDLITDRTIYRSNIALGSITSNEIANYSILTTNLNLVNGNVGIGTLTTNSAKLHVVGDTMIVGNILTQTNNYNIGNTTNRFNTLFSQQINLNALIVRANNNPFNQGIDIIDSIGNPVKVLMGDVFTCNIGIGTTIPTGSLDINNGNILIRNGRLGIGTNLIRQNTTIDAIQDPNSRLIINNVGVGTQFSIEKFTMFGGGFYINSNDTYLVFRNGKLGIGTINPTSDLYVKDGITTFDNNSVNLISSPLNVTNSKLTVMNNLNETSAEINGNIINHGNISTCNIVCLGSDNTIGELFKPFQDIFTTALTLVETTSNNTTTFSKNTLNIFEGGDTNNIDYSYKQFGNQETPVLNNLTNNLYVSGMLNYNNFYPYRNLVINGGMNVNQRYFGSNNFIFSNTSYPRTYTLDRHETVITNSTAMLQVSQSNVNYFSRPFAMTCRVGVTTSTLTSTTNHILLSHKIENLNVNHLQWGTSNASPLTISFDIVSSVSHIFYLSVHNYNRTRSIVRDINVTASTSPLRYTYTLSGDMYGDWRNNVFTSETGINICINTGVGSSFVTALENTWLNGTFYGRSSSTSFLSTLNTRVFITNLQAEVGYMPTIFENRPYNIELQLCRRYYEKSYNVNTLPGNSTMEGIQVVPLTETTTYGWIGSTTIFKIPKRNTQWAGNFYSVTGTPSLFSYKLANGNFFDYTGTYGSPAQPAASNTPFSLKSENSFSFNTQALNQTTRIYAFHWAVDAEL